MTFTVLLANDLFAAAVAKQAAPMLIDFLEAERLEEIKSFGLPKSGRTYYRGRPRGGKYTASAPGEPPAIRSGNLFRSEGRARMIGLVTAERTIGAEYAGILENELNRKFIAPAIETVTQRFNAGRLGSFA